MIFTDFAPNETTKDALLSLKMLFSPTKWHKNNLEGKLKEKINDLFPIQHEEIVFFMSARSALHFTLKALNLPIGTKIAVQGFTCEAVILPILKLNLKPLFIDIDKKTFSMNPTELERKISKDVKIIILQHTYGIIPHRDKIISIAKRNNILVIEDLAHGFQKNSFEKDSNTIKLLSFGRSKSISSVFGGAILFNDKELKYSLDELTNKLYYPPSLFLIKLLLYKPLSVLIKKTYSIKIGKFIHKIMNSLNLLVPEVTKKEKSGIYDDFTDYKYPEALAVLILAQINNFNNTREIRNKAISFYSKTFLSKNPNISGNLIRFPIKVKNRERIFKNAKKNNIFLGKWYDQVIAPSDVNLEKIGYNKNLCPVAERVSEQVLTLPTTISVLEAEKITKIILKYDNS